MSIAERDAAPKRPDLSYLRHRSRPVADAVAAAAAVAAGGASAPAAVADFLHSRGPRRPSNGQPVSGQPSTGRPVSGQPVSEPSHPVPAAAPAQANPLDLSASANPLDLSAPAPPAAPAQANPLDLSAPAPPAAPAQANPLDLSAPAGAPAASATRAVPEARQLTPTPRPGYLPHRARGGVPTVLSPRSPTVSLTRIQSGVGVLTIEAACSPAVGDLRLGCAYQLRSGVSSVVQHASGVRTAPPKSGRPVIIGERGQYERLTVDLVQVRDVERLVIYAFSDSGTVLNWGGTLVLTTFGQARVELPLDRPASPQVGVLMSLYNIAGEFVIRAEMEEIASSVRDAVSAYGFDRITWLDQRTPLV